MGSVCVRLADLEMRRARFRVFERFTAFSRGSWILKCGVPVSVPPPDSGQPDRVAGPPPPSRPRARSWQASGLPGGFQRMGHWRDKSDQQGRHSGAAYLIFCSDG